MKVRLYQGDMDELFLESSYPTRFKPDNGYVTERVYDAASLGGHGAYREIFMENIHIGYGDLEMRNNFQIAFESEMESVEMHFNLTGSSCAVENKSKRVFQFEPNQHNILYVAGFQGKSDIYALKGMKFFEINLMPAFFKRYLLLDQQEFYTFYKRIEKQHTSFLSKYNFSMTPQMHWVIQEILACQRGGMFKKMFIEAKVTELMMLQFEQMNEIRGGRLAFSLKKSDLDKIHAVKEHIASHIDDLNTLKGLAKLVGTNECTLKKGFKEVFGTTVFGYWSDLKLNQAKRMLIEENLSVGEVSASIGYKNPQHFTTAFKKKFGVLPSSLKA